MRYRYTQIGLTPPRPYLEVCLRSGFATTDKVFGLVDSGADYCIFPFEMAKRLKLEFPDPDKVWKFQGTTGSLQIAYRATVEIIIVSDERPDPDFRFFAEVGFCPDFGFPDPLLGQHGFLSNFKTSIFQRENAFEIEPYDYQEHLPIL